MTRGYIKEVPGNDLVAGNHMRMRFVQAGYDADSANVPPNKVIFDSDDIGTLSVIATGTYRFFRAGAAPVTNRIASWSDLGYVPLCTFQFSPWSSNGFRYPAILIQPITPFQKIIVDRTGISVTLLSGPQYVDIDYQVYRLAVV